MGKKKGLSITEKRNRLEKNERKPLALSLRFRV